MPVQNHQFGMEGERIVKGVYRLPLPIPDNPLQNVAVYLITGGTETTLVDTGWNVEESWEALERYLKKLGLEVSDIRQVVLTHLHPDHSGLAARIKEISGATILAGDAVNKHAIGYDALMRAMAETLSRHGLPDPEMELMRLSAATLRPRMRLPAIDRVLGDGEVIQAGEYRLKVISTPGHAPEHICLYEPVNRLLFAGDHILAGITPIISRYHPADDDPLDSYYQSLARVESLDVKIVLPAHQKTFTDLRGRVRGRVKEIRAHHEKRLGELQGAMDEEALTAYQIASRLSWSKPWERMDAWNHQAALLETLAHLEYLRRRGKVRMRGGQQREVFSLVNE